MYRFQVAVLTHDHVLASRLRDEGLRRGLKVVHVTSAGDIPLSVRVVISRRGECGDIRSWSVIYAEDFPSPVSLLDKAVEVAAGRADAKTATISIDPGSRIGVAYMVADLLVRTGTYTDLEGLERDLREFISSHRGLTPNVVIGSGAPQYRERLIRMIRSIPGLGDAPIEIVSEEGTSRRGFVGGGRRGRDERAAANLALRRGHVRTTP